MKLRSNEIGRRCFVLEAGKRWKRFVLFRKIYQAMSDNGQDVPISIVTTPTNEKPQVFTVSRIRTIYVLKTWCSDLLLFFFTAVNDYQKAKGINEHLHKVYWLTSPQHVLAVSNRLAKYLRRSLFVCCRSRKDLKERRDYKSSQRSEIIIKY